MGTCIKDFAVSADKNAGAGLRASDQLRGVRTDSAVLSNTAASAGSPLSWCTERVEQAAWGWGQCWWHCTHNGNMLRAAPGFHAHRAAHKSQTVGKHGFESRGKCLCSRRGRTGGAHAQAALCAEQRPWMALGTCVCLHFGTSLMLCHLQYFLFKDDSS